jgi:hypothetical protein
MLFNMMPPRSLVNYLAEVSLHVGGGGLAPQRALLCSADVPLRERGQMSYPEDIDWCVSCVCILCALCMCRDVESVPVHPPAARCRQVNRPTNRQTDGETETP